MMDSKGAAVSVVGLALVVAGCSGQQSAEPTAGGLASLQTATQSPSPPVAPLAESAAPANPTAAPSESASALVPLSRTAACPRGQQEVHANLSFASGLVQKFGQWNNTCQRESPGVLRMQINGRHGDYAMCCVELQRSLDLAVYSSAKAVVSVNGPESAVQAKLEDGPQHVRILDAAVSTNTEQTEGWELRPSERNLRPTRVCVVATGSGPNGNIVRLHSIGLDGCR
jgi:hypothetical protein